MGSLLILPQRFEFKEKYNQIVNEIIKEKDVEHSFKYNILILQKFFNNSFDELEKTSGNNEGFEFATFIQAYFSFYSDLIEGKNIDTFKETASQLPSIESHLSLLDQLE